MLDDHRLLKPELDISFLAGEQFVSAEERDPSDGLLRVIVEAHARTGFETARGLFYHGERRIQGLCRREVAAAYDRVAAREVFFFHGLEVHRGSLAGDRLPGRLIVRLDSAHPGLDAFGKDINLLLQTDGARKQGAGDDRAEALHGEDAVDGKTQDPAR